MGKIKYTPKHLRQTSKKRRRWARAIWITLAVGLVTVLGGTLYLIGQDGWPSFDADKILGCEQSLVVYDGSGEEYAVLSGYETRIWVGLDEIPLHVRNAFIAVEDARFYDHIGVDVIRIGGAILEDLKAGEYVQGASTLSQQLVKLSHLNEEKKLQRKLKEAVLALELEARYTKDEILEMYLNYVYFGGGYYGVEAAARGYFGVGASEMTVAQGAMLAGILKSPSRYSPHLDLEASIQRRNVVLAVMVQTGFLDESVYRQAIDEDVTIVHPEGLPRHRGYYVDAVLRQAASILNVSISDLLTGGYRIYTGVDAELQTRCEGLFAAETTFPAEDVQGALVVVDARTYTVAAMLGGRDTQVAMGYNRAIDSRRQPGSIIKPLLVYAPALERFGYTAASMLLDEETDFAGYVPSNSGEKYSGWVTLREAVTRSLNIPAVKVLDTIGVTSGKLFASKLGVEFDAADDGLALALGGFTYGVSPLQVAGAFACFAAGGTYSPPAMILAVTNAAGKVLYERDAVPVRVMSEQNAYILTSMLQSAVQEGTGRRLGDLDMDLAGKTGTVGDADGNRDAWMVAYNPDYSAVVWMGYDTRADGSLPDEVTGGTYPALLLKEIFAGLYEEGEAPEFTRPAGVSEYRLDLFALKNKHEALLATAYTPSSSVLTEVFVDGTQPVDKSDYWSIPVPPDDVAVIAHSADGKPYLSFTARSEYIVYRLYREDAAGRVQVVEEFSGAAGPVHFHDTTAQYDVTYQYYVVPRHPTLVIGGQPVVGAASIKVSFTPRAMFLDLT